MHYPEGPKEPPSNQHRRLDSSNHRDENRPRRLHEGKIVEAFERFSDAFRAVDRQWHIAYVNRRAQQLWSRYHEEFLGKDLWHGFRQAIGLQVYRQINRAMEEGVITKVEVICPVPSTWIAGQTTHLGTGYRRTSRA